MRLHDLFRADVRRALNATPGRRIVSFGSMLALVIAAVLLGSLIPWWLWFVLIALEGIAFLVLGNHWAGKDAVAREPE